LSAALPGAERGAPAALVLAEDAAARYAHREAFDAYEIALELLLDGDERTVGVQLDRARAGIAARVDHDEVLAAAQAAADGMAGADGADAAADAVAGLVIEAWSVGDRLLSWRLADIGRGHLDPGRRDQTWARLRKAELQEAEFADPEHGGLPLDDEPRRELQAVMESLPPDELDGLEFVPSSRAAVQAFLAKDPPMMAAVMARWASIDFQPLFADFDRTVTDARTTGNFDLLVLVSAIQARCLALVGRHGEADAVLGAARANLHRVPETSNAAFQTLGAAWLIGYVRGEPSVRTELDLLAGIAASPDTRWASLAVVAANAFAAARDGDVDQALADLEQVVVGIELAPGNSPNYGLIACMAVHALWALGRTDHLDVIEANVRTKLIAPDLRYGEVVPEMAVAQACALTDRSDEGREWLAKAHAVVEEQGTPPLATHLAAFEAEWELRLGQRGDRKRFAAAVARGRSGASDPAMAPWLDRFAALEERAAQPW
jgi:hypothetical protein